MRPWRGCLQPPQSCSTPSASGTRYTGAPSPPTHPSSPVSVLLPLTVSFEFARTMPQSSPFRTGRLFRAVAKPLRERKRDDAALSLP
eukprot:139449-Prorocentrum_minimum.AAC.6